LRVFENKIFVKQKITEMCSGVFIMMPSEVVCLPVHRCIRGVEVLAVDMGEQLPFSSSIQTCAGSIVCPHCCSGSLRFLTLAGAKSLQTEAFLMPIGSTHVESKVVNMCQSI
jgi:hypothetical protein